MPRVATSNNGTVTGSQGGGQRERGSGEERKRQEEKRREEKGAGGAEGEGRKGKVQEKQAKNCSPKVNAVVVTVATRSFPI